MSSILITGGTRGIGAAISKKFASEHNVVALYHSNHIAAKNLKSEYDIKILNCDVSSFESIESNWDQIFSLLENRIDLFVHNAGIVRDSTLKKMSITQWSEVIATNLNSCFFLSKLVVPVMLEQKSGKMIFVSSVNAQKGRFGQTNYSAAKAGVIGFAKSLALEVANYGITVNTIAPGYTETEMVASLSPEILEKIINEIPLKRLCHPEEVADLVEFIFKSQYSTGTTYNLNGGLFLD